MTNVRPFRAEFAIIDQLSRDETLMEQLREVFKNELAAQQRHFDAEFGHLNRAIDDVKKRLEKQDAVMAKMGEDHAAKLDEYVKKDDIGTFMKVLFVISTVCGTIAGGVYGLWQFLRSAGKQ